MVLQIWFIILNLHSHIRRAGVSDILSFFLLSLLGGSEVNFLLFLCLNFFGFFSGGEGVFSPKRVGKLVTGYVAQHGHTNTWMRPKEMPILQKFLTGSFKKECRDVYPTRHCSIVEVHVLPTCPGRMGNWGGVPIVDDRNWPATGMRTHAACIP